MTKVMVVDDHEVVREGLKQIIEREPDLRVVAEAGCGTELLGLMKPGLCDVLVMDVSMPGRNGIDILPDIHTLCDGLPVVLLSVHSVEEYAIRALRAGARAYLTKDTPGEELVSAIRTVAAGRKFITRELAERLADLLEADGPELPHERLSDRELQVFLMIARGQKPSEIAEELSLSVKTIATYRARIFEKTHLACNAAVVHYAVKHGLID